MSPLVELALPKCLACGNFVRLARRPDGSPTLGLEAIG
jgi:hypothetical protein